MSTILRTLFGLFLLRFEFGYASRILAVFPVPFRDHQLIFCPLIENLVERGHQLTVMTTEPNSFNNKENIDIVDLSFANNLKILNQLSENDLSGSEMLRTVFEVMRITAEAELKTGQVQQLLRNDSAINFDAVLVDWSGPSLMNAFAYYFKAPLIGITPGGAFITSHEAIGNPNHPVAFPSILMPFSEQLNLLQRIASTIFSLRYRFLYYNEELPQQDEIAKNYFGVDIPDLSEIESNADLLLINTYQVLGNARPVGPTTIHLGGIHSTKPKPLPWDLQNFIGESAGAVYINFGAATPALVNTNRLERLISILENIHLDIIWNTNGLPTSINTTARIYQSPVMLQEDVLRSGKIRLFITCGGQRDIEDAIHYSVPVFGFSFTSNLEHYLLQIVKHKAGAVANFDIDSNALILAKIEDFSLTDSYKISMERLNRLITDQPQSSIDRAIWWIEYVIRNGGTSHLKHSLNKLSWFQYLLLDVFTTILFTILCMICVLAIIIIRIRKYSNSLPFEKVTRRAKKYL